MSQIEAGLGKPSEELARKLARLFHVDEEEFVFQARDIPSQIEEIKNKFPKVAPRYFRKVLEGENKKKERQKSGNTLWRSYNSTSAKRARS